MSFSDADIDNAITALSQPGRLDEAQSLVIRAAPSLERVLTAALHEGGWFDTAHTAALKDAVNSGDPDARLTAVRTILAEETRLTMLIGVAAGFELARELENAASPPTSDGTGPVSAPENPTDQED